MTFRLSATAAAITVSVLALVALALARPPHADAHPLGNFTVNRYSRLELYSDAIRVRYVLDMAEIPTFQEIDSIDLDGDGQPSASPTEDVSHELTAYPADLLSSPLDVREAKMSFDARGGAPAPVVTAAISAPHRAPERAGAGFASLIDTHDLTLPVLLLSLLLALGFGAIHALEPGHGKTFVAAYFVGVKGTVRQALSLGLTIAVTHTIGVLAIGLITLFGSRFILPEKLYPWLSLASALMILALGVRLIAARAGGWRSLRRLLAVIYGDAGHAHSHSLVHSQSH